MTPPQYPAGPFVRPTSFSPADRAARIADIAAAPAILRQTVNGLTEEQLDTRYVNWTIRQIVHHIADSHVHSYVRFKWTLTEDRPTIKPYDEGRCAALEDAQKGDIGPPLALIEGLHASWVQFLCTLSEEQFARDFFHPESREVVTLDQALASYAWHGKHHTGQVQWLRTANGW
jgi:hypothetical protein